MVQKGESYYYGNCKEWKRTVHNEFLSLHASGTIKANNKKKCWEQVNEVKGTDKFLKIV